jgi:arsenate reductase (thioredoxin)
MKISELAARAGIAPSAVRWYESVGTLTPATRQPNGYRDYTEADLAHLRLIVSLRRLGLVPAEAARIAELCRTRSGLDQDLVPLIAEQRATIQRQRGDLDRLDEELVDLELTLAAGGRVRQQARHPASQPIRVLFVCTGNSARSQIAEAVLGRLGGPAFEVASAGTSPRGLDPDTIRVLAEAGIDWSARQSKSVDDFVTQSFDYVITVCDRARQACPTFPGQHNSLHWGLDDPAKTIGNGADRLAAFRRTYLELTQRIRPFVEVALRAANWPPDGLEQIVRPLSIPS